MIHHPEDHTATETKSEAPPEAVETDLPEAPSEDIAAVLAMCLTVPMTEEQAAAWTAQSDAVTVLRTMADGRWVVRLTGWDALTYRLQEVPPEPFPGPLGYLGRS